MRQTVDVMIAPPADQYVALVASDAPIEWEDDFSAIFTIPINHGVAPL
jgi:hypothetical protein